MGKNKIATVEMDSAVLERWRAHRTGLAPHYLTLYSLVIGMGAQRVFEFGTGESSQVLIEALKQTGGRLITCSPDAPVIPRDGREHGYPGLWATWPMLSSEVFKELGPMDVFDLVLHDGSHSADVLAADLEGILPRVRHGGLVLIHDALHAYVGTQVRAGIRRGRDGAHGDMPATDSITLPFAYGLTILQMRGNVLLGSVSQGADKPTSPHRTMGPEVL